MPNNYLDYTYTPVSVPKPNLGGQSQATWQSSLKGWWNNNVMPVLNYQLGRLGPPANQLQTGLSPEVIFGGLAVILLLRK
jgi:hypothetical protein